MKYLSTQEILIIHALQIDDTGGSHGVRNLELLKSVTHKPRAQFEGKDLYKNIFEKAAVLLEAVVNYHVFVDGNKRTALVVAARFLYINGYEFVASNTETESVILKIATKRLGVKELETWLRKKCAKYK